MPRSKSRNRQTRSNQNNPLHNSASYELAAVLEESKRTANKERKYALQEEIAFLKAAQESKELSNLQNSEALALQLQANENKQSRNAMEKQKHSNYKLAKRLQKMTPKLKKTNTEMNKNVQPKFNKGTKNGLKSGPYEEEKESDPPPPMFVNKPVRLPRTRSKTIARPRSKSKSRRLWPF